MTTRNHQLFSTQSDAYRAYRPTYDDQLFAWLAGLAPGKSLAWDCGCGSGQASSDLARYFEHVVATDVSEKQLAQAGPAPNITYRCEPAESVSLGNGSVDLTVAAQALHWFDVERFYAEVRRVSKPGALLAVISYNICEVAPALDVMVDRLYTGVLGPYWAPERQHVETGYRTIPFPFERIPAPVSALKARWGLEQFLGYLESWSAVASYRAATGFDPIAPMRPEFAACWGDAARLRTIEWPLTVNAGTVRSNEAAQGETPGHDE